MATGLALAAAATLLAGVASAAFHIAPQDKLLNRGCQLAATRIERMLSEAATKPVLTIQTQVRLLTPGTLAGDIVFKRSGSSVTVAGDAAATHVSFACGFATAGAPNGSGAATLREGQGLPKQHVVAVVRETFTKPGRYTLTFTLGAQGRRILARLGAQERAYRQHHPAEQRPPAITWGIGLHFQPND